MVDFTTAIIFQYVYFIPQKDKNVLYTTSGNLRKVSEI
jgi:hypothetical protein